MKEIMNKENDWAHMTEVNMVEGLIGKVIHEEMVLGAMAWWLERPLRSR